MPLPEAPAEEDRQKIAAEIQTVMYDQAPASRGGNSPSRRPIAPICVV
jgi:hypothetical protein